ncbi:MAG: DUF4235 domain-containing protein [Propionibacteriaceae bacterium]|jgi:hypothetical protein|nr:DUF4235 domain-containing protein [Propionibacteriaceae bacterium]
MALKKTLANKTWGMAAGLLAGLLASLLAKRLWKLTTGAEPPDPDDPETSGKAAIGWLVFSGLAQILLARAAHELVARRFPPAPAAVEAEAPAPADA